MKYETNFTINNRKLAKQIRRMLYPQTQPENIRKGKHRPLRVLKKWFNRYQRKWFIGSTVIASINGNKVQFTISDVRLCKMANQCVYRLKGEQSECLDIDLLSRKPISYTHENGVFALQRPTIK